MSTYLGGVQIDDNDVALIGSTLYGFCTTPAATANKVVSLANFDKLMHGVTIVVNFSYGNTVLENITLAVGSVSAIQVRGNCICSPNEVIAFTYEENGLSVCWRAHHSIKIETNNNIVTSIAGQQVNLITQEYLNSQNGDHTHSYLTAFDTIGGVSQTNNFVTAIRNYFEIYNNTVPRNAFINFLSTAYNQVSDVFGYFASDHDDAPNGGFFVANYDIPRYVGIYGGTYEENILAHISIDSNITSGQILISDGTNGRIRTSGFTIATSVPENAIFTDHYNWSEILNKPTSITLTGAITGTVTLNDGDLTLNTTVNHTHSYAGSDSVNGPANELKVIDQSTNGTYYLWFGTNNGTTAYINSGLAFDINGVTVKELSLFIGASNITGKLQLYNSNGRYSTISNSTLSQNRNYNMPDEDGTIALIIEEDTNKLLNLLSESNNLNVSVNDYLIVQVLNNNIKTNYVCQIGDVITSTIVKTALLPNISSNTYFRDDGNWIAVQWSDIGNKPLTFPPETHTHSFLSPITEPSLTTTPNTYNNKLEFEGAKLSSEINDPSSDTYSFIVGLRGENNNIGNAHELAFNNHGINWRTGATTTWGNWKTIAFTDSTVARAIADDAGNVITQTYVGLDSPHFIGVPTAPTASDGTNSTQIATTEFVLKQFRAIDAMIFKGGLAGSNITVEAPAGTLTPAAERGDTYKITNSGYINGIPVEIGDVLICCDDNTPQATLDGANQYNTTEMQNRWVIVQTNIDGAVTGDISSTNNAIARFNGTTGRIIKNSTVTINDDGLITSIQSNGSSNEAGLRLKYSNTIDFGFVIGTDNITHGLYDYKLASNNWIVYAGSDNIWHFKGNSSTTTSLATSRTIWGQSFNGTANITGDISDVGPNFTLPSGYTEFKFYTTAVSNTSANIYAGKLGLNNNYSNIDLTNYILDVNGQSHFIGQSLIEGTSSNSNKSSQIIISNIYDTEHSTSGPVALELWREGAVASWQLSVDNNIFYIKNNYTTTKQETYSNVSLIIDENTNNIAMPGHLVIGSSTRDTTNVLYVNGQSHINGYLYLKDWWHYNSASSPVIDASLTSITGTSNANSGAIVGTEGKAILTLGNNIALPQSDTDGGESNSTGYIRLYSSSNTYGELKGITINNIGTYTHATNGLSIVSEGQPNLLFGLGAAYITYISNTNPSLSLITNTITDSIIFSNTPSTVALQIRNNNISIGEILPAGTNPYKFNVVGLSNFVGAMRVNNTINLVHPAENLNIPIWSLINDSGEFYLTNNALSAVSLKEIMGNDQGFKLTSRLYINETIPTTLGLSETLYSLYIGEGDTCSDGSIIPTYSIDNNDNTKIYDKSLGSTTNHWSALYVGNADTYGDPYLPIYWLNGVPAYLSGIVQYKEFTITPANGTSITITSPAYNQLYNIHSYVIQIVITSGFQYLNGPITASTSNNSNNTITLTTEQVSGNVSGYIITSRGCEAPNPPLNI